jgi:hypothetical protein
MLSTPIVTPPGEHRSRILHELWQSIGFRATDSSQRFPFRSGGQPAKRFGSPVVYRPEPPLTWHPKSAPERASESSPRKTATCRLSGRYLISTESFKDRLQVWHGTCDLSSPSVFLLLGDSARTREITLPPMNTESILLLQSTGKGQTFCRGELLRGDLSSEDSQCGMYGENLLFPFFRKQSGNLFYPVAEKN